MDGSPEEGPTESDLWDELNLQIDAAVERPSRAQFARVGQAAVEWSRARRSSARGSTCYSCGESLSHNDPEPAEVRPPQEVLYRGPGTPHLPGDTVLGVPEEDWKTQQDLDQL